MAIEKSEIERRSNEQFKLFVLNLTASGAIAAFAVGNKGDPNALLIIPWFSFITFTYWIYQAISIRSADLKNPTSKDFWEWIRRFFASTTRLSCFALIPWGAIKLHSGDQYKEFKLISSYIPLIICVFYAFWFYYQYIYKIKTEFLEKTQQAVSSDRRGRTA